METEEERRCGNCKHFACYYFKYKERLKKTDYGVCVNSDKKGRAVKSQVNKYYACGLWQPCELQSVERRESVKDKLRRIAAQLDDIALILKDDE